MKNISDLQMVLVKRKNIMSVRIGVYFCVIGCITDFTENRLLCPEKYLSRAASGKKVHVFVYKRYEIDP